MTNAELMTKSERCGALLLSGIANIGCAKVERVVLNALQQTAALPPDICAFGDHTSIVFREADPPWQRPYPRGRPDAITLVDRCFRLRHLVIPLSFDIRIRHCRGDVCATASHGRIRRNRKCLP